MTRKEFLSQAYYMNRQIKAKEKRLDWLRELVPGPTSRFGEEAAVPGDPKNSAVENAAIKVVTLEEEIAGDILQLVDVVRGIENVIRNVESVEHRTLLEMRYLSFLSWDQITDRMGYGTNTVFRKHREAIDMVRIP